jgi:hemoglobin-like flavoprotein
MTPRQVELVQSSFRSVLLVSDSTAQLFYARLFALDPALQPLFKGGMKEQGKKLMYTLGAAVAYLKQFDAMVPALEALAQRHTGYGVKAEHYQTFGDALLWALGQALGEAFTDEVCDAWAAFYGELSGLMQGAANGRPACVS